MSFDVSGAPTGRCWYCRHLPGLGRETCFVEEGGMGCLLGAHMFLGRGRLPGMATGVAQILLAVCSLPVSLYVATMS